MGALLKIGIYCIIALLILVILIILFLYLAPTFGGSPKGESLEKINSSKNFNGKTFQNLVSTSISNKNNTSEYNIFDFIFPAKNKNPSKPLPSVKFDKKNLIEDSFTWFGHSTILIKTSNMTVLTDPVFNRASPIPIFGKAFEIEHPFVIEDLPNIDVVVISHDHYDHLDYNAVLDLDEKVSKFLVPLGVKAHFLKWGIDENKVEEFDWYDNLKVKEINFTFTPSKHFSGRGITNTKSTLWGSWIINSNSLNVFFSGDTGYFDEFKKIGEKFGPFDISFIENGAYNKAWADIHMFPEESAQVSIDLKSKVLFPIHWSKFDLSLHKWTDPIDRIFNESKKRNINLTTPLIGETFTLKNLPKKKWWKNLDEN